MLIFAVVSYCFKYFVCSLSRLSEINAKIRNICEKDLSVVYANDTKCGDVYLTDYFSSESNFF